MDEEMTLKATYERGYWMEDTMVTVSTAEFERKMNIKDAVSGFGDMLVLDSDANRVTLW